MTDHTVETSPQVYARVGGALYLLTIVFGLFAESFVNDALIVSGDSAATVLNILAHPLLWRFCIAGNMLMPLLAVGLLLVEYVLLRSVSKHLMLLAVFFNLVSLALEAVSNLYFLDMLVLLGDAEYLTVFTTA
jgi:hypothetical protein